MKIVFFGNAPEKIAAIRYRIITFARRLEAEGHRCVVCLPSSVALKERLHENKPRWMKLIYELLVVARRLLQMRHVVGADVVFFRGPLLDYGPPVLERAIRLLNPRIVFDIDDAIWEPPAHVDSPFVRFMDLGWVRKLCGFSAHAVVGNEHLAAHVRPMLPRVTVIPTCIDMDLHAPKTYPERGPQEPVVLGWTGLKDNLGYLKMIEPVLQALARSHGVRMLIASGRDYALDGVEVINQRWEISGEIRYLQEPDIGLMPLLDSPRARGKCAFKALQYMAVGTPCVISPVGMNAEVIKDGVNGFLADSPEEWRDKLTRLIEDPGLRQRLGVAARDTVRERFSHDAHYPRFKAVMESVAGARGRDAI